MNIGEKNANEDPGEAGLLRTEGSEEAAALLLVPAAENLVKDDDGGPVHLVEPGKAAGEGDAQCDRDVVLPAPAEPAGWKIVLMLSYCLRDISMPFLMIWVTTLVASSGEDGFSGGQWISRHI